MTQRDVRLVAVDTAMGERLLLADTEGHVLGNQTRMTIEQQADDAVYVTITFQLLSTGVMIAEEAVES
ncbi:hypothetical protein PANO111632_02630 [Paracoccus nototheniae]|uniref:Uncharacterized protein n=1 Tax=Paracoccus nototheniae TaxID=2489002 RepID=A0ABW4DWN1_9RHOB|nr:hypothetical protein [Paracoccus nototheniae]